MLVTEGPARPRLQRETRTMDLNSLLSQEQLALMQADAATSAVELAGHDRALSALRPLIEAMGFPHRPYRKPGLPRSPQFAGNSMERPSRRASWKNIMPARRKARSRLERKSGV